MTTPEANWEQLKAFSSMMTRDCPLSWKSPMDSSGAIPASSPLRGAHLEASKLNLGFAKDTIKDAPDINPDDGLSTIEQDDIFAHYGVSDTEDASYFHPEIPELPEATEVGILDEATGTALPGDNFAAHSQAAEAPEDAKTEERDAADDTAEAERIRLRRFSGR